MADAGNKWYVLKAVSGKEAKVKEYIEAEMKHNDLLAANVSQVLIPVEKHATVRNGKRVVKEKVSLPGYVFVEAKLKGDVAHTLRFLPNVLGFLGGLRLDKLTDTSQLAYTVISITRCSHIRNPAQSYS